MVLGEPRLVVVVGFTVLLLCKSCASLFQVRLS